MDNNFDEIFNENELNTLNEELKKNENITLPQSLSTENITKKIKNVPREKTKETVDKSKKHNKKMWIKFVSCAAVFAIVLSSLIIAKPWKKPVIQADDTLKKAEDYSQIENMFSEYCKNYKKSLNKVNLFSYSAKSGDVMDSIGATAENADEAVTSNANYGKTNEQVAGVSEADIIKNDGQYLYVNVNKDADWSDYYAENGKAEVDYTCEIAVLKQYDGGKLQKISSIKITPPENSDIFYMYVNEFYVNENYLTVLLTGNINLPCNEENEETENELYYDGLYYTNTKDVTVAVTYDITDKSSPKQLDCVMQDGAYLSSRMIGEKLVLLSDYYIDLSNDEDSIVENCIPKTSVNGKTAERISTADICIMDKVCNTEYLVASVMNIKSTDNTYKVQAVLGGGQNVYCTTENLYVTNTIYSDSSETDTIKDIFGVSEDDLSYTQIYKFTLTDDAIKYSDKAFVIGTALNQFSIDEFNGNLRIATTTGFWGESLENYLTVLNENLEQIGFIDNIAKGETIKSVRFSGNIGYVVTFEQTDPLFVIDLSEASEPKIIGELEIPGFSNYLHPVSDTLLLGIGVDGDENGSGNGFKVSLFDVSDPENPKEVSKYEINGEDRTDESGNNYLKSITSEAFYNHKAVCWDDENKIMFIPVEENTSVYNVNEDYSNKTEIGSVAIKVDETKKSLEIINEFIEEKDTTENYYTCTRVTFTGETVYNLDTTFNVISSYNISTGEKVGVFDY